MSRQVTIRVIEVTAADVKAATVAADAVATSNRASGRTAEILPAAFAAAKARGGDGAEITASIPQGGKSPVYNMAHRSIGNDVFRQTTNRAGVSLWKRVQVLALVDCTQSGEYVTGTPSSTATRGARVFIVPAQ